MKTAALVIVMIATVVVAQTRSDVFSESAVAVTAIHLQPLADGGCAARWCGELPSEDGGIVLRACTDVVELRATLNQNRCAALEAAGEARVLRELRFPVDGGAP